jgi:rsbT co-antagonist protein RsbR
VALSPDQAGRFADLLKASTDHLVGLWTDEVAQGLRGRLSHAELQRQTSELLRGFTATLAAGAADLDGDAAAELRAMLTELSTGRARQGFTATETAISVYALKDALLRVLEDDQRTDADGLRDYVAFARFVDQAALVTFDSYVRVREELIADQAEQLLELSTPVVKLSGRAWSRFRWSARWTRPAPRW